MTTDTVQPTTETTTRTSAGGVSDVSSVVSSEGEEVRRDQGGARTGGRGERDRRHAGAGAQGGAARRPRRVMKERVRNEFEQKIISIRRVTRVVAGGRRFNFSVTIVIGNGRGKVGVGLGKAGDTALAIEKALADARKHLITIPLTKDNTIPHDVRIKYAASQITMAPAPGRGLKAGSSVRTVLELGGVKHISVKILSRSKNPLNNARATVKALAKLRS